MADADEVIRGLAASLVDAIEAALPSRRLVPPFTDATWNWYEPGVGHISRHRDPPAVGGVIAVFTLKGCAEFTIDEHSEFDVTEGDLVLLAGNGWPDADDVCVLHAAGRPRLEERVILTLRHNVRGPGRDFF